MKSSHTHLPKRQRGVTLIVAMIFLAILALLGVTVAQTTQLEERMAGNTRDRDLAFQATEAALTWASKQDMLTLSAGATIDTTAADDAVFWNAYNWGGAIQLTNAQITVNGLAAYPQLVVERRGTDPRYRVTSRGVGASANTVVILQAEYDVP